MIELKSFQPLKKFKILLIGDNCTDVYQYGTVDRISPEAPVPVFKFSHQETKPGMGGNVKQNLEALGCQVTFITDIECSVKTRFIDLRSKQHLLRLDEDATLKPLDKDSLPNLKEYDAIVISDYNKGCVSYELVEWVRQSYNGPMFIDTKKQDIAKFNGIFVKINELEYKNRISENDALIVTLGSKGAMYKTSTEQETVFECQRVEVVDVTGAGDTFLSAVTYAYLTTKDILRSIEFANLASSITVQHFGVYAPRLEQITQ